MRKMILLFALCFSFSALKAQQYVVDTKYLTSVLANTSVRNSAEATHNNYLGKINTNLNTVNTNASTVVAAQTIIYNSLSNVNSALKDGLAVKNITHITGDIIYYLDQMMELAKDDPALVLFVSQYQNYMGPHITALVSDISGFVLKEGGNMLADYNARDQLLRKIIQQLQMIDGLAYGAWRAMYWAQQRGVLASANPFAGWINKDKNLANQIIINAKFLQQ
jgi:hypothetical protein